MEVNFQRSRALNNLPLSKVQYLLKSIILNCNECKLTGGDPPCKKCAYTSIAYHRYAESNIPIDYWNLKMEKNFEGDKRLLNKYNELVTDLNKTFIDGTLICFAGAHGLGKTFSSTCILKKAAIKGFSCLYSVFNDVVNTLVQAPNEDKWMARKELTMVDFLVIDELDPRFVGSDNAADLYARTLETVFRTRLQNKLPTIICTNSPNVLETFQGPLKESLGSLMNKVEQFPVLGDDYRNKK